MMGAQIRARGWWQQQIHALAFAERLEAADLVDLALDELLPAEAGVNAHDEHQVHDVDDLQQTACCP